VRRFARAALRRRDNIAADVEIRKVIYTTDESSSGSAVCRWFPGLPVGDEDLVGVLARSAAVFSSSRRCLLL
jgi:hypothetical protein